MMKIHLSSVGNPDFRQDETKPLPGVPNKKVPVKDFAEASKIARAYIEEFELGCGNCPLFPIYQNRKVIATVSYNGRVWEGDKGAGACGEWEKVKILYQPESFSQ